MQEFRYNVSVDFGSPTAANPRPVGDPRFMNHFWTLFPAELPGFIKLWSQSSTMGDPTWQRVFITLRHCAGELRLRHTPLTFKGRGTSAKADVFECDSCKQTAHWQIGHATGRSVKGEEEFIYGENNFCNSCVQRAFPA